MQNCSDEQLINNYLRGDEKSLEILIQRYLKSIHGFVYRYTNGAQETEDIVQEVFVRVWRNIKKFDPRRSRLALFGAGQQKSFKVWIFHIAKNAAIDFFKKKKVFSFSSFENEKGENIFLDNLIDSAPLPSEIAEQVDAGRLFDAVFKKLPSKYRAVIFLRHDSHLTFREIAESLGEPLHTVKSRHRRALILVKKMLPAC